jgi:hypothetical protein
VADCAVLVLVVERAVERDVELDVRFDFDPPQAAMTAAPAPPAPIRKARRLRPLLSDPPRFAGMPRLRLPPVTEHRHMLSTSMPADRARS